MKKRVKKHRWHISLPIILLLFAGIQLSSSARPISLATPGRWLIGIDAKRPQRVDHSADLFRGVAYARQVRSRPRPLVVHTITVDLTAPGVGFLVTPHDPAAKIAAQPTTAFLREHGLQIAINANWFEPFRARFPWDYYPRRGDSVELRGLAMANGVTYSEPEDGWPMLCLGGRHVSIDRAACPPETTSTSYRPTDTAGMCRLLQVAARCNPVEHIFL